MGEVQKKLGYALKLERERRSLSIEDLSHQLKISESNLQAIEDGDPSALPGELYFKMFARSYAEALGIDYERTIEAIKEELGQSPESNNHAAEIEPPEPKPTASVPKPPFVDASRGSSSDRRMISGGIKSYALMAVLILAVIGLAFVLFGPRTGNFGFLKIGNSQSEITILDSADEVVESDAGAYRVVAGSKDATALVLEMQARDRTWATVVADGDTAVNYNLKPYREYVVGAQEKLLVSIVSPLAVDLSLNGIEIDLSDPEKGTVQGVEVTTDNMSLFIKRALTDSAGIDTANSVQSDTSESSGAEAPPQPLRETTKTRRDTLPTRLPTNGGTR